MQGAVLRLGDAASHTHEDKSLTPRYRHNKLVIVSTSSVIKKAKHKILCGTKGILLSFSKTPFLERWATPISIHNETQPFL